MTRCLGPGCLEARATRAEQRMQRLSVYDLGQPNSKHGSCSAEDPSGNVGSDGKPVDVFGEEQAKYGYMHECLELGEGVAVLHRPAERRSDATVLHMSGYGRNFDTMALADRFRSAIGADLCGLDFHGYGIAYRMEREGGGCDECDRNPPARRKPRDSGYCNYTNINEYFADLDLAITRLESCGYRQIIFWANSTAGLTCTRYLAGRLDEGQTSYRGVVAVVMSSPFWSFCKGKFGPLKSGLDAGPCGLSATRLAGACLPLVPRLVLAYDPEEAPTWMDTLAAAKRPHRYDRTLTLTRKKPNYAGYVGCCLQAQMRLEEHFCGRRRGGLGRLICGRVSSEGSPPLSIPAVLATTPTDAGVVPIRPPPPGVDKHINVERVHEMFPHFYGNKTNEALLLPMGEHEMLQADDSTIDQILSALKRVLTAEVPEWANGERGRAITTGNTPPDSPGPTEPPAPTGMSPVLGVITTAPADLPRPPPLVETDSMDEPSENAAPANGATVSPLVLPAKKKKNPRRRQSRLSIGGERKPAIGAEDSLTSPLVLPPKKKKNPRRRVLRSPETPVRTPSQRTSTSRGVETK